MICVRNAPKAPKTPHPAPSPSEVGPVVVEVTRMTQEEAEARGELCGYGSFGRQGYVQCLRDLGLILPEPVDADVQEAERIEAEVTGGQMFDDVIDLQRAIALAAIKRGRALASEGK